MNARVIFRTTIFIVACLLLGLITIDVRAQGSAPAEPLPTADQLAQMITEHNLAFDQLEQEWKQYEADVARYEREAQAYNQRVGAIDRNLEAWNRDDASLADDLQAHGREIEVHNALVDRYDTEVEQFDSDSTAYDNDVENHNAQMRFLENDVESYGYEVGRHDKEARAAESRIREYNANLADYNGDVTALEGAVASYNREKASYESEVQQYNSLPPDQRTKLWHDRLVRWKTELDNRVAELDRLQSDLQQRFGRLNNEKSYLEAKSRELISWEERLDSQYAELSGRQAELDRQGEALDARLARLQSWQQELDQQGGKIDARKAALDSAGAALDRRLETLESRSDELDTEGAAIDKRKAELDRMKTELDARFERLQQRQTVLDQRAEELNQLADRIGQPGPAVGTPPLEPLQAVAKSLVDSGQYEPDPATGATMCNLFVQEFARRTVGYTGFSGLKANQIVDLMRKQRDDWTAIHDGPNRTGKRLTLQERFGLAQRLANEGSLVVVGWKDERPVSDPHGHVAVVVPGELTKGGTTSQASWGPRPEGGQWLFPQIAQAGDSVFAQMHLGWGFSGDTKDGLVIYVYQRQDVR